MKDFSRSHAAVAVTFDGAYVMLPESFDKKKRKLNTRLSGSPLIYLVTRFMLPSVVFSKFKLKRLIYVKGNVHCFQPCLRSASQKIRPYVRALQTCYKETTASNVLRVII